MYYPKSQITTNLYSNGELIYVENKKTYIGNYWKNSSGKYFTGKNPQDSPIEELILKSESALNLNINPIAKNYQIKTLIYGEEGTGAPPNIAVNPLFNQIINNTYGDLIKENTTTNLPYFSPTFPTNNDYQLGKFTRYFCKKTNEIIYLEIDLNVYTRLVQKNPNISYQLYKPFIISWQLTGNKTDVYKTNRNIVELIMFQQKLLMFDIYLKKDFTKYYKET